MGAPSIAPRQRDSKQESTWRYIWGKQTRETHTETTLTVSCSFYFLLILLFFPHYLFYTFESNIQFLSPQLYVEMEHENESTQLAHLKQWILNHSVFNTAPLAMPLNSP